MAAVEPPVDRSGKTIVVIDDVQDLAEVLVMLFGGGGLRPSLCLSGKTGIALVAKLGAYAVLLDHMLPDMIGAEVGIQLRQDRAMRGLKILMYTSTPEEVVRPIFADYEAFLIKPVHTAAWSARATRHREQVRSTAKSCICILLASATNEF